LIGAAVCDWQFHQIFKLVAQFLFDLAIRYSVTHWVCAAFYAI